MAQAPGSDPEQQGQDCTAWELWWQEWCPTPLSFCREGLLWLCPRLERAGLAPTCLLGQEQDLSHKCHVSVKLWNLCVCLEIVSSFYLRASECVCAHLCTCVHAPAQSCLCLSIFGTNETLLHWKEALYFRLLPIWKPSPHFGSEARSSYWYTVLFRWWCLSSSS
jgi:hypothetical protein